MPFFDARPAKRDSRKDGQAHRSKVAAGGITLNLHRMVRVVSLINHNLAILG